MGGSANAAGINTFLDAYAQQLRRERVPGGDAVARAGEARLLGSKLRLLANGGAYIDWAVRHAEVFLNHLPPDAGEVIARAVGDDGVEHCLLRADVQARIEQMRRPRGTR